MTETEREQIRLKAQSFFDDLWTRGDPWELETSSFEHQRYKRLLSMLDRPRYGRALEIGCGAGTFTRRFASLTDQVLALDVSSDAIAKARAAQGVSQQVEFRAANIMDYDPKTEAPWDLIIMSDMVYFLGWLYPLFDIGWLAMDLFAATRPGGQLLLANCYGGPQDYLMLPSLIHTYRDLFINVGYQVKTQKVFHGVKNGVNIEALMTLFEKTNEKSAAGE
jgi:2-polyprenyl-3-methyl-5-hydroxy-6-metoxy-1,4-benzoquinol methylase